MNNAFTKYAFLFDEILSKRRNTEILSNGIYNLSTKYKIKSILDIGCGGGDLSHLLNTFGFKVTGIDNSKKMIELAMRKNSQSTVEWINDDFFNLIEEKKFDLSIAFYSFFQTLPSNKIRNLFLQKVKKITRSYCLIEVQNKNVILEKYPFGVVNTWNTKEFHIKAYSNAIDEDCYQLNFDIYRLSTNRKISTLSHKIFYMTQEGLSRYFNQNDMKVINWYDSKDINMEFKDKLSEGLIVLLQVN